MRTDNDAIRPGQRWRNKTTGRVVVVGQRATGNGHWRISHAGKARRSHHIHEGTLRKFYDQEVFAAHVDVQAETWKRRTAVEIVRALA